MSDIHKKLKGIKAISIGDRVEVGGIIIGTLVELQGKIAIIKLLSGALLEVPSSRVKLLD